MIKDYNILRFTLDVVVRDIIVLVIAFYISMLLYNGNSCFIDLLCNAIVSFPITSICVWFGGVRENERAIVYNKIKKKINK